MGCFRGLPHTRVQDMALRLVKTFGDYASRHYNFIVWDEEAGSNVKILGRGDWSDWGEFCRQIRENWEAERLLYEDDFEYEDRSPSIAVQLLPLIATTPLFVENAEKMKKRLAKGPLRAVMSRLLEEYITRAASIAFIGFVLFLLGLGLWSSVAPILGGWGVIDYETEGDRRYTTFLDTVVDCQVKDTLRSPEKTDKWPRYAVYTCPDGSRKTWRYKVEVVTEFQDKLIVE